MKFFLIGTGLIGGSMSKDLRNILNNIQIHGIDKNEGKSGKNKENKS